MAYEEFLKWADEDTLAEGVNGEVVMYSSASKLSRLQYEDCQALLNQLVQHPS